MAEEKRELNGKFTKAEAKLTEIKQIGCWCWVQRKNLCNGMNGQASSAPCVVRRLGVDKGLKLWSGILDTLFNTLCNTRRKGGRRRELKIVYTDDFEYCNRLEVSFQFYL